VKEHPFSLGGKVALVTGANRGIGRSISLVFARAGAKVVLVGRNAEQLEQVAGQIAETGGAARSVLADVSSAADAKRAVVEVESSLGGVDVLVNNAGIGAAGRIEDVAEEDWDRVIDVNLKGMYLWSQAVAPHMEAKRWGRIVSIASISGQTGGVSAAVSYSASKGGMIAMTKTLARDLAPFGITVNAICPGQIMTDMSRNLPPDRIEKLLSMIPLRRLGEPEDIAYAVLFLASEEGGYVTGATLDVNGGILMR
jgi:3-oxoacyl-[acyl-carrier protein] reductase